MNAKQIVFAIALVDFAVYSGWALMETGGLLGFIAAAFANPASTQVAIDLGIFALAGTVVVYRDAKAKGLNPVPWALAIPLTGSLGLLTYLIRREAVAAQPAEAAGALRAHQAA